MRWWFGRSIPVQSTPCANLCSPPSCSPRSRAPRGSIRRCRWPACARASGLAAGDDYTIVMATVNLARAVGEGADVVALGQPNQPVRMRT